MKNRLLYVTMALAVTASAFPMGVSGAELSTEETAIVEEAAQETVQSQDLNQETVVTEEQVFADVSTVQVAGVTYEYVTVKTDGYTQIPGSSIYYKVAEGQNAVSGNLYGTATLSYSEFYAGDTTKASYDAVTSATTGKSTILSNGDSTEVTDAGYQILGVKNVKVAVDGETYVQAQILKAAAALPESGVYVKAAGITLNENSTEPTAKYKMLQTDGTYKTGSSNVIATITSANMTLNTNSNWGDYELDIAETDTSHIRNDREDTWDINSEVQGIIVKGYNTSACTGTATSVGMRHMQEIWVQPYEIAFDQSSELVGKYVNEVTYLTPEGAYVYSFANPVYIKPQITAAKKAAMNVEIISTSTLKVNGLSALTNPKVNVYYKEGRVTTYYAQDVVPASDGTVTLTTPLAEGTFTVLVEGDNYAAVALEQTYPKTAQTVTVSKSSYTKKVGDAAFSLGAKTSGDGTLTYQSSNTKIATVSSAGKVTLKSAGTVKITVYAKEGSTSQKSETKTITIKVNPKAATLSSAKAVSKGFTAKWKKVAGVTGYQISYSTSSKFTKATTVNVKSASTVSKTVKSLKAGKKYYVRIRTYSTVSGKTYYSTWSKTKTVTTKK